ncbi:MAG: serine/threonine-protein kinase [Candidatus Solibacter sp.]
MKLQRVTTDGMESPGLVASNLPPEIVDRAVAGLCWVSVFAAVTSTLLIAIEHLLQPEFAKAWQHPVLRLASLFVVFLSLGFVVVQRAGWLRKDQLLYLGMFFQVAVAFCCALFECAAYENPNMVVLGHSGIAIWMMMCALLMPNAPLRTAATAALSVLMWPLGYWVDLQIFGYQPMPLSRLLVWVLPLVIVGFWMCVLNKRVLAFYVKQERAEDVGSYVLDSLLGTGGMGEVWRAKHRMLARMAAVKLIRSQALLGSTGRQESLMRRRFEREAQATASLRSPHTVALYDFGLSRDGSFYYAMELLDGVDLQTMVDRFGPMEPARVRHILYQTCKSLDEAHRAGLVHRDVKPRNIMLCKIAYEYDFTKVLDFGLVKSLHQDREESIMTMDGVTTGTPAYLPPEMALGARDVDGRADLYSLGCVAYFLLTGSLVFDEPTAVALAIAHTQKKPVAVSQRAEMPVPAGLEEIVMQLLEKDPANRIQTAAETARRLRLLRDVPDWCPDRAAAWWETNLPERNAQPVVENAAGSTTPVTATAGGRTTV